jgi:dUTP pyrophosphatase
MSFLYSLIDKLSYFKVKLNDENSKVPAKAESGSAGYDVFSVENCVIEPSQRKLVSIGISIEIPRHCYLRCAPRSGLSCNGIDIGAGVIDASYRGTIKVLMINNSKEEYIVSVGDKIELLPINKIPLLQM